MMSPLAKGLFQRAWMLSASAVLNKTLEKAIDENDWILKKESITGPCGVNVTEKCLMGIRWVLEIKFTTLYGF
jgi:carboxylesterase type B